ncbi:poly(3-hydroxyalkanoate) polymerase [Candidatus Marinamargulisbacteria bacterium SCGC AG-414-C22]|nr:poly(3-hydroxyalkanoate) polymerase [Candidatus Marinamargulisbacteria bacterium SCGC AG-414-C22]
MNSIEQLKKLFGNKVLFVDLYEIEEKNTISLVFLKQLQSLFDQVENESKTKVVVLYSSSEKFCLGMDFQEVSLSDSESDVIKKSSKDYFELLKKMTIFPKVIISVVTGSVNAGGVGLMAASDIVIADVHSTFSLSEVLFDLIPACVLPYLIRRVGFQNAQWMAMTAQTICSEKASKMRLIDDQSPNTSDLLRRYLLRFVKSNNYTIKQLKEYLSELYLITEHTQEKALLRLHTITKNKDVYNNIKSFVSEGVYPWEK